MMSRTPQLLSMSAVVPRGRYSVAQLVRWLTAGLCLLISPALFAQLVPPSTVLNTQVLQFPAGFMPNIKTDYGAVGDGITDDTNAIKAALADGRLNAAGQALYPPAEFNGRSKALYFPPGIYLVSDTLKWVGCCVTLQGAGPTATVIKLVANAPLFQDAAQPRPLIQTENGNESFRQNIWDLAVVVGPNNPGAIGIDHISNNAGAMKNVLIKSEDGRGHTGLDMRRNWPGPGLYKRVQIEGFDVGIRVQYVEYSQTYEDILLKNQRVAAISNNGAVMSMRRLYSINIVPVIKADEFGAAFMTLVDCVFIGGGAGTEAILAKSGGEGRFYFRNVRAEGYNALLRSDNVVQPGLFRGESYLGEKYALFPVANDFLSLRLPVAEAPESHDNDISNWAMTLCNGYTNCPTLQGLQTALTSGKPTVALVFGNKIQFNPATVVVPPSVKRIVGFTGALNEGGVDFEISDDSPEPLIIEGVSYGARIVHKGKRTVVIKYGFYGYRSEPGAGDVIVEDVGLEGFTIRAGQRFWAHHINNEYRGGIKLVNDGGQVWIFGMKTEGRNTVIETKNGGVTEYLGGLIYPATDTFAGDTLFTVDETSRLSATYSGIAYTTRYYDNQVTETKGGITRTLTSAASPVFTHLYRSPPIGCAADVDQSGSTTSMPDALILLRYANGQRGASLAANTSLAPPNAANASNAERWIDTRLAELDVDNDGAFDVRDALVLQRYALGFRGNALSAGIIFNGPNSSAANVADRAEAISCR